MDFTPWLIELVSEKVLWELRDNVKDKREQEKI